MVLHKFALPGGKVPAATGMRAAGRPPKTLPPPGAAVFGLFLSEGVRFLRLMFFRRFRTFCGRDRTDSPSPARASQWVVFIHLAVCRFWAFAVGKNGSHPRKAKQLDRFYPPLPLVDFGPLRWGGIVPIPARARQTDGFFIPYRPVLPTAGRSPLPAGGGPAAGQAAAAGR